MKCPSCNHEWREPHPYDGQPWLMLGTCETLPGAMPVLESTLHDINQETAKRISQNKDIERFAPKTHKLLMKLNKHKLLVEDCIIEYSQIRKEMKDNTFREEYATFNQLQDRREK